MSLAEALDLLGRIGITFYFLWAAQFNFRTWDHQISEFRRIGLGAVAVPALVVGLAMMVLGAVLLLVPQMVLYGAVILILFTLGADILFHRFWTYRDPGEQIVHKFFLFEHFALCGALLVLVAARLN